MTWYKRIGTPRGFKAPFYMWEDNWDLWRCHAPGVPYQNMGRRPPAHIKGWLERGIMEEYDVDLMVSEGL